MAQNVRPGRFDRSFRQAVNPPNADPERRRTEVHLDDLLITIVGANTGDVCRVDVPVEEHYVCQSVALLRPVLAFLSGFMELFLYSSEGGQRQFARHIYGAGRPHLSFDQLELTGVPVPCGDEIEAIISAVDQHISDLDATAKAVGDTNQFSTSLRQSILAAAFCGKLVPQAPDDEPASELLARIRAERGSKLGTSKVAALAKRIRSSATDAQIKLL